MGIRFACHACGKPLNIKDALAGKRGKCPGCGTRFRVPLADQEYSLPADSPDQESPAGASAAEAQGPPQPQAATASGPAPATPVKAAKAGVSQQGEGKHTSEAPRAASTSQPVTGPPPVEDFDPLDDPQAQWFVRPPAGGRFGPADGPTIRQWIAEGRITPTTLLWREEWPQWREFSDVLPEAVSPPGAPQVSPLGADAVMAASTPVPTRKATPAAASPLATASPVHKPAGATASSSPSISTAELVGSAAPPAKAAPHDRDSYLGAKRRRKARRRALMIAILVATSLILVAALVVALVI